MPEPDALSVAVRDAYLAAARATELARRRGDSEMLAALEDARDALASVAGRLRRRAQEGLTDSL